VSPEGMGLYSVSWLVPAIKIVLVAFRLFAADFHGFEWWELVESSHPFAVFSGALIHLSYVPKFYLWLWSFFPDRTAQTINQAVNTIDVTDIRWQARLESN
jgi:hypothetical protein